MKNWIPTIAINDPELGYKIFGINTVWDFKVHPVAPVNGVRFEVLEDAIAFINVLRKNNPQSENVTFAYVEVGELNGLQSCYKDDAKNAKLVSEYYMLDNCPEAYHCMHGHVAQAWGQSDRLKKEMFQERKRVIEAEKRKETNRKPIDWKMIVVLD